MSEFFDQQSLGVTKFVESRSFLADLSPEKGGVSAKFPSLKPWQPPSLDMAACCVVIVVGADSSVFVGRFVVGGGVIVGRQRGLIEGIGLIDFLARLRWAGVNRYILKPKPVEFFAERI